MGRPIALLYDDFGLDIFFPELYRRATLTLAEKPVEIRNVVESA